MSYDNEEDIEYIDYVKSLIHFDKVTALPLTVNMNRDDILNASNGSHYKCIYMLVDEIQKNKIQTVGHQWRTFSSVYSVDENVGKYANSNITSDKKTIGSAYPYHSITSSGGKTFIKTKDNTYSLNYGNTDFFYTDYPLILGGQDFTIEASFYNKGTQGNVFSFSPITYIYFSYDTVNAIPKRDFIMPDKYQSNDLQKVIFSLDIIDTYFQLTLPVTDKDKKNQTNSMTFAIYDDDNNIVNLKNKYLQVILMYHYKDKYFEIYVNGKSAFERNEEGKIINVGGTNTELLEEYGFPRIGFLSSFIGQSSYYSTDNLTYMYFDEFRLCDGIALYKYNNEIKKLVFNNTGTDIDGNVAVEDDGFLKSDKDKTLRSFIKDHYLPKIVSHFDNPNRSASLTTPISLSFLQSDGEITPLQFSHNIAFNGDHQYLELMSTNYKIDNYGNLEEVSTISTSDGLNKLLSKDSEYTSKDLLTTNGFTKNKIRSWKSGITLGGQNFTIESFLKIYLYNKYNDTIYKNDKQYTTDPENINDTDKNPWKYKRTVFEFNELGCTEADKHYFRLIVDYEMISYDDEEEDPVIEMILEQSLDGKYKELGKFYVPLGRTFHWFICYHANSNIIKVYIDYNRMNMKYLQGNVKTGIKNGKTTYTYTPTEGYGRSAWVDNHIAFTPSDEEKNNAISNDPKIKRTVITNVNFPKTTFQQFLIAGNVAPMKNSSEDTYPYANTFYGEMEEFRLLDGVAVAPYTPEKPYKITDPVIDWDDDDPFGPKDILTINFEIEKPKEEPFGPKDILNIDFEIEKPFGPKDILNIDFEIEKPFGPKDILNIDFEIEKPFGPKDILNIDFNIGELFGPKDILQIDFEIEKPFGPKDILQIDFEIEPIPGEFGPKDILNIDFNIGELFGPKDILNIDFEIEKPFGPENILQIDFEIEPIPGEFGPKNILNIDFNIGELFGPKDILKIDFEIEPILGQFGPKDILKIDFEIEEEKKGDSIFEPKNILNIDFKIADKYEYLIIAVSFN